MADSESPGFTLQDAHAILDYWRDFDLDSRRASLDKQCFDMREMKTTSMSGRKHLNELTRTFRSKSQPEQLAGITEVLKAYQEEIDQLSRRAKFSESAFYGLYKDIFEAPDPCTALDGLVAMLASTSTNGLEIERLKGELMQYDAEFQQLKNQDITIRRLEDQLAEFRDNIEDRVREESSKRASEAEATASARVAESRELQRAAERRLTAAVEAMRQAQASADRAQTQVFEISQQAEGRVSALLQESSILAESSDRAAARALELEREVEALKASASTIAAGAGANVANTSATSNSSLADGSNFLTALEEQQTLAAQLADLRVEARRKEEIARSERTRLEAAVREATQSLAREKEAATKLRTELSDRPSKEELQGVRRQLRVLQRVAFNVEDEEGERGQGEPEYTEDGGKIQALEAMLAARLKGLEAELAETRAALQVAQESRDATSEKLAESTKQLATATALVARLERDLEASSGGPSSLASSGGVGAGASGRGKRGTGGGGVGGDFGSTELGELLGVGLSRTAGLRMGDTREIVGASSSVGAGAGVNAEAPAASTAAGGISVSGSGSGSGSQGGHMISILQAQRDRYKLRLSQAEAQCLSLQQQVSAAVAAKKQSEADNLALYGKIRFLSSKEGLGPSASPVAMKIRDRERRSDEADVESHYEKLYEQRLNPFAEFSQQERQRRLNDLSVADRVVFTTLSTFIAHKTGRGFLVAYFGLMHVLVMAIIWYLTHRVHHGCDPALDHSHS